MNGTETIIKRGVIAIEKDFGFIGGGGEFIGDGGSRGIKRFGGIIGDGGSAG